MSSLHGWAVIYFTALFSLALWSVASVDKFIQWNRHVSVLRTGTHTHTPHTHTHTSTHTLVQIHIHTHTYLICTQQHKHTYTHTHTHTHSHTQTYIMCIYVHTHAFACYLFLCIIVWLWLWEHEPSWGAYTLSRVPCSVCVCISLQVTHFFDHSCFMVTTSQWTKREVSQAKTLPHHKRKTGNGLCAVHCILMHYHWRVILITSDT